MIAAFIDVHIPDAAWIDALRGVVVVSGALLLVAVIVTLFRYRRVLGPRGVVGLAILAVGDLYIGLTEAEQIGHRMLVWRLPLGVAFAALGLYQITRIAANPSAR